MRLLFCVEFYFPSIGGAQEVVRQIAERMVSKGHNVSVVTTKSTARASLKHSGVDIIEFDVSGNLVKGIRGEVSNYRNFLTTQTFDIVFFYAAQQWTFDASWEVFDKIAGKKVLVPCGYSGLYDAAYKSYFSELGDILQKMDAVVYHARDYRDFKFAATLGLSNSVVIPNGADLEEFDGPIGASIRLKFGAKESAFVILTVGTITGMKGHLELVRAYAEANFDDRDTLLILNGNRPVSSGQSASLFNRFIALIRGYGLLYTIRHTLKLGLIALGIPVGNDNKIERIVTDLNRHKGKCAVLVNLPRAELLQAYLQADLFVFASNIEYSPLVLFEAAAAGLPFLTVPVGNSHEIIEWTGGGEICPAAIDNHGHTRVNPKDLARNIESLAKDEVRRIELGKRGKAAAFKRFNWTHLVNEYESLFIRLVAEGKIANE